MIAISFLAVHSLLLFGQYFFDRRSFSIFNPKILFQIYLIIQLPIVLLLAITFDLTGFNLLSPEMPSDRVVLIGSISLIAHVFFLIGYYLVGHWYIKAPFFSIKVWNRRRASILSGIFFVIGYVAFFGLLIINGGYSEFMANREVWRAGGMSGQGWLLFPATTLIAIGAIILLITHRDFFAAPGGVWWFVALLIFSVLPASQLGFRGLIMAPALQLLFVYHFKIKPLDFSRAAFSFVVLAVFFTTYGLYREMTFIDSNDFSVEEILSFVSINPEMIFSLLLRSKGAEIVTVVIDSISNGASYTYFYPALIEAMVIVVPRAMWEDKGKPLSVQFSEDFFGLGGGVSPTIVGEAYWHAGVFGVVFILLAVGAIMRIYWNTVIAERGNNGILMICASIFPALFLMAESLQIQLNSISILIFFMLVVIFLLRIRV